MAQIIQTRTITVDEIAQREAQEGFAREITGGKWVEETEMAGERHGQIILRLTLVIAPHVLQNQLGRFHPDQVTYILDGSPDDIRVMRIPDLSFVRAERVRPVQVGYLFYAPDLAIEVVSPTEKAQETRAKIRDYLTFGTQEVWVFYPEQQLLVIHLADGNADLLPDLEIDLAPIFEEA